MRRLYTKFTPYFFVFFIVIFSTLALWAPFLLKQGSWLGLAIKDSNFHYVYRHYDGPFYLVAAKTLYKPDAIKALELESTLQPSYFAAHLPLYPLLIRTFAPIAGFLKSIILVNLIATIGLALFFYYLLKHLKITDKPLLLTAVFLFLPRFLVVRSVGAPESLFILFILSSLYFFEKRNFLLAGLLGGLSVATKSPGILLFGAYGLSIIEEFLKTKKIKWDWLWLFLIPAGLLTVFILYSAQYGDFFAYFNSGDNIHLVFPFSAFNAEKVWVGTAWLEDIIFYYVMYGLSTYYLWKSKYRSTFYFSLVFFVATLFVQHRDIARYSLPLWPLAIIAFEKFFTSRAFLIIFILILIPAAYFYGWNFMLMNVLPISNWKPYL